MSFEPVDVYVKDTGLVPAAIAGVVVAVYDSTGTTPVTQATTDALGLASFLLDADVSGLIYTLRLYKAGVNFTNPKSINVLPAPEPNIFDISGVLHTAPVSVDNRICIAYGSFRTSSGAPAKYVDMHFIPKFSPLLLDGSAVLTERIATRTDKNGYVEVPLIRWGQYDVMVEGREDLNLMICVPDQNNVNLPDLLFPVVSAISFDPSDPVVVAVDETVTLTPTVLASDGQELEGAATSDVRWSTDDPTVAIVDVAANTLIIRGISGGTCNLIATRIDTSVVRIPDTAISGVPLSITVIG